MINNNVGLYSGKLILEIIKDLLFFPVWWYSYGVFDLIKKLKEFLKNKQKSLALFVWIKNIFVPMYGQYDFAGHIISFLVRLFQIIFRSVFMLFWISLALFIVLFWLFLPFLVIYEIIFQVYL